MDYQVLFNIVCAIAGVLGAWVVNNVTKAIDRLDTDVRQMPSTYVSKTDFKDALKELKLDMHSGFDKIDRNLDALFNRIDGKEDKLQ